MKRIISLVLACMMIFGALTFSSCDTDGDAQSVATQGTTSRKDPELVDLLNGMNAKQLMEKFLEDFKNAKSRDFDLTTTVTDGDGESVTEKTEFKLSENREFYLSASLAGIPTKMWYVEYITYLDIDGEQHKTIGTKIEDVFGEEFLDDLISIVPSEQYDTYIKKFEEAKIYYYRGVYYSPITYSADEAEQMGMSREDYTETVYFNREGAVIKIVDNSETTTRTINVNSYGKKVTVDQPKGAMYFDYHLVPPPIEYLIYCYICNRVLSNARIYSMRVMREGQPYVNYSTDGRGESVQFSGNDTLWKVGGKGYVCDGTITKEISLTDERFSDFDLARQLKSTASTPINDYRINVVDPLSIGEVITFSFDDKPKPGSDWGDTYSVSISDDFRSISIKVVAERSYKVVSCEEYFFTSLNDKNFSVLAPEVSE